MEELQKRPFIYTANPTINVGLLGFWGLWSFKGPQSLQSLQLTSPLTKPRRLKGHEGVSFTSSPDSAWVMPRTVWGPGRLGELRVERPRTKRCLNSRSLMKPESPEPKPLPEPKSSRIYWNLRAEERFLEPVSQIKVTMARLGKASSKLGSLTSGVFLFLLTRKP